MASIKCSKCEKAIRFHGEPAGIEYIMIFKEDWEVIKSSKFDSKFKVMDTEQIHPKLFRTDTIEEDFPNVIKKFWKCPNCGTLLFFDGQGCVTDIFVSHEEELIDEETMKVKGVVFDDFLWDKITDSALLDSEIEANFKPSYQFYLNDHKLILVDVKRRFVYKKYPDYKGKQ